MQKLHLDEQQIDKILTAIDVRKAKGWRGLTFLEKSILTAQFATVLAFPTAALFSFLGWHEAREASELAYAEKVPRLDISKAEFSSEVLFVYVQNYGQSYAENVHLEIRAVNPRTGADSLIPFFPVFAKDKVRIYQGENHRLIVNSISNIAKVIDYSPTSVQKIDAAASASAGTLVAVTIYYTDALGKSHFRDGWLEFQK